jgi:hypothetical protein
MDYPLSVSPQNSISLREPSSRSAASRIPSHASHYSTVSYRLLLFPIPYSLPFPAGFPSFMITSSPDPPSSRRPSIADHSRRLSALYLVRLHVYCVLFTIYCLLYLLPQTSPRRTQLHSAKAGTSAVQHLALGTICSSPRRCVQSPRSYAQATAYCTVQRTPYSTVSRYRTFSPVLSESGVLRRRWGEPGMRRV